METNRLEQFCAVIETGGVRSASELLNMTHGALSKSLKVLEGELGYTLFLPAGRGIVPTEKAKLIYPKIKKLVKDIGEIQSLEDEKHRSEIKIATFEIFSTYSVRGLLPLIKEFDLTLHETRQGELEEHVANGTVDFGVTYEPIPTTDVEFLKIGRVSMKVYGIEKNFKTDKIEELPFIAPVRPVTGAPSGVKGLDGWPDHLQKRSIRYKVDMLESALCIAREGNGVVYLPEFIAIQHNRIVKKAFCLKEIECTKKVKTVNRSVFLVKRKSSPESLPMKKVSRWLRNIITS